MPADSTATSVPAPMAMPTSAVASAGASFTPSPTMATLRPPCLEALDGGGLVRRQDLRGDLVDAKAPRDGVGDSLAVAGDHRDPNAERVQGIDGFRRLGPDFVLDRDGRRPPGRPR